MRSWFGVDGLDDCKSFFVFKVPQAVGTSASGGDMGVGGGESGEGKTSGVSLKGLINFEPIMHNWIHRSVYIPPHDGIRILLGEAGVHDYSVFLDTTVCMYQCVCGSDV